MAAPLPPPPPNPPPIALPAQPNDPNVPLPAAPAVKFRQNVDVSIAEGSPAVRCTPNDRSNSVLYEHGVVAQAVAVAGSQAVAPPWFQGAIQQLRTDLRNDIRDMILPDLKRLLNQSRGEGNVVPQSQRWSRRAAVTAPADNEQEPAYTKSKTASDKC